MRVISKGDWGDKWILTVVLLLVLSLLDAVIAAESVGGLVTVSARTEKPKDGPHPPVPTVKFVDLLSLQETRHQAEFVVKLSHNPSPDYNPVHTFANARSIEVLQNQTVPGNSSLPFNHLKVKVTVGCTMAYILYPFDSHLCSLAISVPSRIEFCKELSSYEFNIRGFLNLPVPPVTNSTGSSQLVSFIVSRTSSSQILTAMYTPALLLTLLSFLTMFNRQSYAIRIGSSLTLLICGIIVTSMLWRDIPRNSSLTLAEHYFAICIGFIFQVVFTNILMDWYTNLASNSDKPPPATNGHDLEASKSSQAHDKLSQAEEFISKLGKCHKFVYFKILKPAKKQLPIAFLIINLIYWPAVIYLSSGLPTGFQPLPLNDAGSSLSPLANLCV